MLDSRGVKSSGKDKDSWQGRKSKAGHRLDTTPSQQLYRSVGERGRVAGRHTGSQNATYCKVPEHALSSSRGQLTLQNVALPRTDHPTGGQQRGPNVRELALGPSAGHGSPDRWAASVIRQVDAMAATAG
jgi:hypothetical protein